MEKNKKLQGLIYSQFDSAAACAKALGWDRRKLHKITSGKVIPTLADACALAKCLNTSIEQMANIILHGSHQMDDLVCIKFEGNSALNLAKE